MAAQAGKAVNISLTLRNWAIGCYIAEYELRGSDRAAYGERLLPELEKRLTTQTISNCNRRQLYDYLKFYRTYPQIVGTVSAQLTDVEAVELLQNAWPSPTQQKAQWVELINVTPRDDLLQQWNKFILSHHADTTSDFYESRIARHPRRTGEAWAATHLYGIAEEGNPLPRDASFIELLAWFDEFRQYEVGRSL